jgi:hypothetical protein
VFSQPQGDFALAKRIHDALVHRVLADQLQCPTLAPFRRIGACQRDHALLLLACELGWPTAARGIVQRSLQTTVAKSFAHLGDAPRRAAHMLGDLLVDQAFVRFQENLCST